MRTLKEVRVFIAHNKAVVNEYNSAISNAEKNLERNLIIFTEEEQILERKIGVCDYYRERHPDSEKTDEEIIKHMEMLEEKYGESNG